MTDADQIAAILREIAHLRTMFAPRPTPWDSLSHDDQAEMSKAWVEALAPFGAATVADALDMWFQSQNMWFPTLNDVIINCTEVDYRRRAAKALRMPASKVVHCDGSGWIDEDTGMAPCPRCNPWLRVLYGDAAGWRRFLEGASLHLLLPELRHVNGHTLTPDGQPMPPSCEVIDDPDLPYLSFEEGIEYAQRAYVAEAAASGRPVDMKRFNATVGMIR